MKLLNKFKGCLVLLIIHSKKYGTWVMMAKI